MQPEQPDRAAQHADMRIEVVKRELNQGALAGFDSSVTAYAAQLVVAALDSYDAAALKAEYERGVQHGKVVQTIFGDSTEKLQAEYELGIAEGRRQALAEEAVSAEACAASLDTLPGQEQAAAFYRLQAEHLRNKLAEEGSNVARGRELHALLAEAYARGRRQATEGWEREWGVVLGPGYWPHACADSEDQARGLATLRPERRAASRLVGPWEPAAEQPEPAYDPAYHLLDRQLAEEDDPSSAEDPGDRAEQPEDGTR